MRGGSFARALPGGSPTGAAAAATAAPPPAAAGPRRNGFGAAPHEQDEDVTLAPCAPSAGRKVTVASAETPHIVRGGPSGVKGAPFGRVAAAMGASAHP